MTMIGTPDEFAGTPALSWQPSHNDLLSDVLGRVRLSGAMFLRGEYSAPWAFASPGHCDLVDLLAPEARRLLIFHVIRQGEGWIAAGGSRLAISAGDFVVLPHADPHRVGTPGFEMATPIETMLPPHPWPGIPTLRCGGGGAPLSMICGYFCCDDLLFESFLTHLPAVFKVRPTGPAAALLEACIAYACAQSEKPGGAALLVRVPEVLLVEALRLHAEETAATQGWLAAAVDPVVGRALRLMHEAPARDWTAAELARLANTSRSVLGERFRTLLGKSPIRYLIEWRMQLAAQLLRDSRMKLAAIAEEVGYGSEAAFSRAFARHLGTSPAQWREAGTTPAGAP
jgi:AraC-like DNA-binding protein